MKKCLALVVAALSAVCLASAAVAGPVAVVNVDKILSESKAAKAGQAHLVEAQKILQGAYDKLAEMYKGKEQTDEAKKVLAQAEYTLNQQMDRERAAVNSVLSQQLSVAVNQWYKKNSSKYDIVLSSRLVLAFSNTVNITPDILKIVDSYTPKFPELPKVTVNPPAGK